MNQSFEPPELLHIRPLVSLDRLLLTLLFFNHGVSRCSSLAVVQHVFITDDQVICDVAHLLLQLLDIHLVGSLADLANVTVRASSVAPDAIHLRQGEGGLLVSQHVVGVHHQERVQVLWDPLGLLQFKEWLCGV